MVEQLVGGSGDVKLDPGAEDRAVEIVDFGVWRSGMQVEVEGGQFSADSNF